MSYTNFYLLYDSSFYLYMVVNVILLFFKSFCLITLKMLTQKLDCDCVCVGLVKVEEKRKYLLIPIRNLSYILLVKLSEASSFRLHSRPTAVLSGSLSTEQQSLTDAATQKRGTTSRADCCKPTV